jgi:hypothetical protein
MSGTGDELNLLLPNAFYLLPEYNYPVLKAREDILTKSLERINKQKLYLLNEY